MEAPITDEPTNVDGLAMAMVHVPSSPKSFSVRPDSPPGILA